MKESTKIQVRLEKIRRLMQKKNIDAFLVLSSDYHDSEYVGGYFKCREYISGFTGSAGNVVITQSEAGLWTDGRYFLQAEQELKGSSITLYRMKEENVPGIEEYLLEYLPEDACLGLDGRTMNVSAYRKLKGELDKKNIKICVECDLIGEIWEDRPEISCRPAWELDVCYAGKTRAEKFLELRKNMVLKGADSTIISSLDDIAWVLNVRGADVACTPVVLGFLIIAKEYAIWFVQDGTVDDRMAGKLKADGIMLREYQEIYDYLARESEAGALYLDPDHTSIMLYQRAQERMQESHGKILEGQNLTLLPKAMKNTVEIENIKKAHVKDAIACTKFIYWLKKQMNPGFQNTDGLDAGVVTEISAAKKMEEFRTRQEHYLGASFDTIAGYAHHGAIVHYSATEETDIRLKPENLFLIDSGGHYLEGTTDITRTVALGPLTWKQKHHYTLVLKGNLRLSAARFKYGCSGISLDHLAREALWNEGLDYNHGTGHGVGYLLSVHESPNSFRSAVTENRYECMKLEAGMVTSNEPGIYIAEEYGIRLENLIVCKEVKKNEYGKFMEFETLTLVPFEREAVLAEELDARERELLNRYHENVFHVLSSYLEPEEREWLAAATAPL